VMPFFKLRCISQRSSLRRTTSYHITTILWMIGEVMRVTPRRLEGVCRGSANRCSALKMYWVFGRPEERKTPIFGFKVRNWRCWNFCHFCEACSGCDEGSLLQLCNKNEEKKNLDSSLRLFRCGWGLRNYCRVSVLFSE
jgi:hypothetical protein